MTGTFESEEVTHVEGDVNPVRDIEIINEELRLKDEAYLMAQIDKTEKTMRSDKKMKTEYVSPSFLICGKSFIIIKIYFYRTSYARLKAF